MDNYRVRCLNYFNVNMEGSGYQVISNLSSRYLPMIPPLPGISGPGYPFQPWASSVIVSSSVRGQNRLEQVGVYHYNLC